MAIMLGDTPTVNARRPALWVLNWSGRRHEHRFVGPSTPMLVSHHPLAPIRPLLREGRRGTGDAAGSVAHRRTGHRPARWVRPAREPILRRATGSGVAGAGRSG